MTRFLFIAYFILANFAHAVEWSLPSIISSSRTYVSLHTADIDGDGKNELLAGFAGQGIEVWSYDQNTNAWTLQQTINKSDWYDVYDISSGDFDKDGDTDLAVAMRFNGSRILLNQGSGSWNQVFQEGTYAIQAEVVDFDNDTNPDVFTMTDWGYIKIFYGDGQGNFVQWGGSLCSPTASCKSGRFSLVDLNKDGLIDFIGGSEEPSSPCSSVFRVYLNQGNRNWSILTPPNNISCGIWGIGAKDMNNDGYIDYVAGTTGTPGIKVFWGGKDTSGNLTWSESINSWGTHINISHNNVIKDLSMDGIADVVTSSSPLTGINILYGNAQGGFSQFDLPGTKSWVVRKSSPEYDFNQDGINDIIFVSGDNALVGIIYSSIPNTVPILSEMTITGMLTQGQTLSGKYIYADADQDLEGGTFFQWYRAEDSQCSQKTLIHDATDQTYLLTGEEVGKYLCLEITPVAQTGLSPGQTVLTVSNTMVSSNTSSSPSSSIPPSSVAPTSPHFPTTDSSTNSFLPPTMSINIEIEGSGLGSVTSDTGLYCQTQDCVHQTMGIACNESACRQILETFSEITLVPMAEPGSVFSSWGGHEDCVDGKVSMESSKLCTAYFHKLLELKIVITGAGEVTHVYDDPPLIMCGLGKNLCSHLLSYGTTLVLQATPAPGAYWAGWRGDCQGNHQILSLSMQKEMTCEAVFNEPPSPPSEQKPSLQLENNPGGVSDSSLVQTLLPEIVLPSTLESSTFSAAPQQPHGSVSEASSSEVVTPVDSLLTKEDLPLTRPAGGQEFSIEPIFSVEKECPTQGTLNRVCNAQGRVITELDVEKRGNLSHGILEGHLVNKGWVGNLVITPKGQLTGGIVTGYIDNQGTMKDFEFRGRSIVGGKLGGRIVNTSQVNGYFQDVTLLPYTYLKGGILKGTIRGDKNAPALLENVRVRAGSHLIGILLCRNVELEEGVIFEESP